MLIDINKEELCLISIALNEYQMQLDNYHLDEMRKVSSRIDNLYNNLSSNKEVIQRDIMEDFEVVVLLGDNLNDFSRDYYLTDVEERRSLASERSSDFGVKNIIFPNPTDGHWIRAIFGESEPAATSENRRILRSAATRGAWQP